MNFDALQRRVQRRERLLEGRLQQVSERADTLKTTWRDAWTPGRILIAGVVSGFLLGRAEPVRFAAKGTNFVQIMSLLTNLFAGSGAQSAASGATQAAHSAERAADAAADAAHEPAANQSDSGAPRPAAHADAAVARGAASAQASRSAAEPVEP